MITELKNKIASIAVVGALVALNTASGQGLPIDPHSAISATMDGGTAKTGNTWYEVGVNTAAPTTGLPTGLVTGETDPLSTYQIQPAVGLNALLLDAAKTNGSITFQTPIALKGFSFAAADGNGSALVTPTLNFMDGTSETLTNFTVKDWFNNTPIVHTVNGRVDVTSPGSFNNVGPNAKNPRVLAINITNTVADAAKLISSISFTWKEAPGNSGSHTCIFGVSGDTNGMGHYSPIALTPDSYNQDMIVGVVEETYNAYVQNNLVSDLAGMALITDTNLVNPWGLAAGPNTPVWVTDNGTGVSTVYSPTTGKLPLTVTIPVGAGGTLPAHPTGIVFNGNTNDFGSAKYIFATEEGTISSWATGATAVLEVDNSASKASYKGLALGTVGTNGVTNLLYAANFVGGTVDVFDSNFKPVLSGPPLTTKATPFVDTNLPAGFAPFNVASFGTNLYVTYALRDTNSMNDVIGPGNGFVNLFDTSGNLLKRFATNGVGTNVVLNSPWGLAVAPNGFGAFSGALLVGNFGDGKINGFDRSLGTYLGPVLGTNGNPLVIKGLWGLLFGNGAASNVLFFAAGIPGSTNGMLEDHGLLGSLSVEMNQPLGVPWELLQSVNGYQDDFTAANRNTNWVAVGPGGDHYVQTNGVLQVSVAQNDPNHLVYKGAGGSNSVQEVLARIRVVAFGAGDPERGGIGVGVNTNLPGHATDWSGVNINFRNHNGDVTPAPNIHLRMLDDLRSWGPQLNLGWTNNVWYWLRLRMDPKADGVNDYFGKVWLADGTTAEPSSWQMLWKGAPTPLHSGYAGITGCSGGGLAQTEVDYVLIKSPSLPAVKASFGVFGPQLNLPTLHRITEVTNKVVVDWFGGTLQSGGTVTGPWKDVANTPSPYTNSITATSTNTFYRVRQ